MRPLTFVDSFALIALGNEDDEFHEQAKEVKRQLRKERYGFVTSTAILLEYGNAFSPPHLRSLALQTIQAIERSKSWECIKADTMFDEGLALFKNRPDKEWGLVDCISILIAERYKVRNVFTHDHHFEQAGFSVLLES